MTISSRLDVYVHKYFVLFRPRTVAIYLFPLTLGFATSAETGGTLAGYKIACVYVAFLCGTFFASTLNFYADAPADRLHNDMYKDQPISKQPFVTGEMGKVETALIFTLSTLGCVGFSLLVSPTYCLYLVISMFILGVVYSHPWFRFKAKPVLDVVTNASAAVLILISGWKAVNAATWPPFWPLLFGFVFSATLYIPSVANDVPFDEAVGFKTSGVVFGAQACLNAMIPMCILLVPIAVVNFVLDVGWLFKLFFALALPGAIAFTIGMHLLWRPPHIRFNTSLMIYPISGMLLFYFVYGVQAVLR
jgi:4-hydroxybenzoate polyprenyltransferase